MLLPIDLDQNGEISMSDKPKVIVQPLPSKDAARHNSKP
jgi:hypothetical protein